MDKMILTFILIFSIGAVLCDKPDHKDDIIDTPIFNITNSEAKKPNPVPEDKDQTQPPKQPLPEYYNPPFDPENPSEPLFTKSGSRLITINELAAHGSVNGTLRPIWLAIMGRVYDVEKGYDSHYGPKGGYNFFTGRDGSKAFVTGKFDDEGLTDDVSELTPLQLKDIEDWIHFYDKDYTYVGKLIARYYDKTGNPTKELYKYQRNLAKAEEIKAEQQAQEKQFPPCNSRYTPAEGGLVYCSTNSGGIQRDWEGLPRRYFIPGTKDWRCACVNDKDLDNPHIKLYPGCAPNAPKCKVDKQKLREEL